MGAPIEVLGGRSMEEDTGAYYKKRAVILKTLLGQLQSAVVYVGSTFPRDADGEVCLKSKSRIINYCR